MHTFLNLLPTLLGIRSSPRVARVHHIEAAYWDRAVCDILADKHRALSSRREVRALAKGHGICSAVISKD